MWTEGDGYCTVISNTCTKIHPFPEDYFLYSSNFCNYSNNINLSSKRSFQRCFWHKAYIQYGEPTSLSAQQIKVFAVLHKLLSPQSFLIWSGGFINITEHHITYVSKNIMTEDGFPNVLSKQMRKTTVNDKLIKISSDINMKVE